MKSEKENQELSKMDKELGNIEFFKIHPNLLPFIGDRYDEYRILQVGESHYINQTPETEKFDIGCFERWWNESCDDLLIDSPGYVDTRGVLNSKYLKNKKGSYGIFTNAIKSFSKVVFNEEILTINEEKKQLYNYFAFMNFFQIPSIYYGKGFWKSLYISGKKNSKKELAHKMWDKAVQESTRVLDEVIDILNPRVVAFTSISAGEAYKRSNGRHCNDSNIIYTSHPNYSVTWNKSLKTLDGKKGFEIFEEGLRKLYK